MVDVLEKIERVLTQVGLLVGKRGALHLTEHCDEVKATSHALVLVQSLGNHVLEERLVLNVDLYLLVSFLSRELLHSFLVRVTDDVSVQVLTTHMSVRRPLSRQFIDALE